VPNPLIWFAAAVVAAAPAAAGADVYKWTDERGVASYGERPPARARNVTRAGAVGEAREGLIEAVDEGQPFTVLVDV